MNRGGVVGGLGAVGVLVATVFATLEPAQNWLCANYKTYCPSGKQGDAAKAPEAPESVQPVAATGPQEPAVIPNRRERNAEEAAWTEANAAATAASYQAYLDRYPDGRYAATARSIITRLQPQPAVRERTGYSYKHTPSTPQYGAPAGARGDVTEICRQWAASAYPDNSAASLDPTSMMNAAAGMAGGSYGSTGGADNSAERQAAMQRCVANGGPPG